MPEPIKILVADDHPLFRRGLVGLLSEQSDCIVVGEANSGPEAVELSRACQPDVVLLDVQMAGASGLQIAADLARLDPPPAVVLVTAFPEYALDAFEQNVADCLLKPVRRDRLLAALQRLPRMTHPQRTCGESLGEPERRRHLSAYYRGGVQTVAIEDVLYLLAEQKYVTVRHPGGRMLIDESLKALEQEFPERFMRIHRNALVAGNRLVGLEKSPDGASLAVLEGCDDRLPVSRRHLPEVRRFLRAC